MWCPLGYLAVLLAQCMWWNMKDKLEIKKEARITWRLLPTGKLVVPYYAVTNSFWQVVLVFLPAHTSYSCGCGQTTPCASSPSSCRSSVDKKDTWHVESCKSPPSATRACLHQQSQAVRKRDKWCFSNMVEVCWIGKPLSKYYFLTKIKIGQWSNLKVVCKKSRLIFGVLPNMLSYPLVWKKVNIYLMETNKCV